MGKSKIVLVNNSATELNKMEEKIESIFPEVVIEKYTDPMYAVKYILDNEVEMVFAEAQMQRIDGFQLLHICKVNKPECSLFITDKSHNLISREDAKECGADGYFQTPLTKEQVMDAYCIVQKKVSESGSC